MVIRVCECEIVCECRSELLQENIWILELADHPASPLLVHASFMASLLSGAWGEHQTLRSPVGFAPTHCSGSSLCASLAPVSDGKSGAGGADQERSCAGCGFHALGKLYLCPAPPDKGGACESLAQAPPHQFGSLPSTTLATSSSPLAITHLSPSVPITESVWGSSGDQPCWEPHNCDWPACQYIEMNEQYKPNTSHGRWSNL